MKFNKSLSKIIKLIKPMSVIQVSRVIRVLVSELLGFPFHLLGQQSELLELG